MLLDALIWCCLAEKRQTRDDWNEGWSRAKVVFTIISVMDRMVYKCHKNVERWSQKSEVSTIFLWSYFRRQKWSLSKAAPVFSGVKRVGGGKVNKASSKAPWKYHVDSFELIGECGVWDDFWLLDRGIKHFVVWVDVSYLTYFYTIWVWLCMGWPFFDVLALHQH